MEYFSKYNLKVWLAPAVGLTQCSTMVSTVMDLKKTCNKALIAFLLTAVSISAVAQVEILDRVVAVVDEDVVLNSEVQADWPLSIFKSRSPAPSRPLKKFSPSRYSSV